MPKCDPICYTHKVKCGPSARLACLGQKYIEYYNFYDRTKYDQTLYVLDASVSSSCSSEKKKTTATTTTTTTAVKVSILALSNKVLEFLRQSFI